MSRYKVVLLGEGSVGKTSILMRFMENTFEAERCSTLQDDSSSVSSPCWLVKIEWIRSRQSSQLLFPPLRLPYTADGKRAVPKCTAAFFCRSIKCDGQKIELAIWDTAGQERFHSLGPIYYRDSDGALLVYDITDQFSFEKVKQWVKELRRMLGSSVQLSIVGNKIDLQRFRNVTLVDAQRFADEVGASHCLTSAKTNEGIEQAFLSLCERMIAYRRATLNEPENRMNDGVDSISFYGQEKSRGRRGCC
ncbi:hypothetical protein M514_02814 [Trichuris suis]|uniref:Ras-related protein Rab-21 n=1 Tax=Trichuris suis TaxID=68888 RepID=A0A085NEM8_9BILA|nr:hypothetical protein M514_02814 [Trichuris suis]